MDAQLSCQLISLNGEIYSGSAYMVILPCVEGELAVMKDHLPLVSLLKPGSVRIITREDHANEIIFYVSGGMMEIRQNKLTVLSDEAQRPEILDEDNILQLREQLKAKMQTNFNDKILYSKLQAEIMCLNAQIHTLQLFQKRN